MTNPSILAVRGGQRRTSPFKPVSSLVLKLTGWKVEGVPPNFEKFVLVVAPHTSNWDVPIGFFCGHALELLSKWRYGFMVKDTIFRSPLGSLLRWMGGIPIDRRSPQNIVEQMIAAFHHYDHLMLAITPEGTRSQSRYWKSGFYHIAVGAKVPIVLAFLDYRRKVCGLGPTVVPSGSVEADMDLIREFYVGVTAKYPEQVGEVRFKPGEA